MLLLATLPVPYAASFVVPTARVSGETGRFFTDSLMDFLQRFRHLGFTERQLSLLCALVICNPEGLNLQQPSIPQALFDHLSRLLQSSLGMTSNSSPGQVVITALTDLRTLHTLHQEKLQAIRFPSVNFCMSPTQSSVSEESLSTSACPGKDSSDTASPSLEQRYYPDRHKTNHPSPNLGIFHNAHFTQVSLRDRLAQDRTLSMAERHRAVVSLLEKPTRCAPLAHAHNLTYTTSAVFDEEPLNLSTKNRTSSF